MKVREVIDALAVARQKNIRVYAEMAELVDAESLGFEVRVPGERDVTLELIRQSFEEDPERARPLLQNVIENDKKVTGLAELLWEITG